MSDKPRCEPLGDTALLWTWSGGIGIETSRMVLDAYRALREDTDLVGAGMVDIVPAYNALAVHFEPAHVDLPALRERVEAVLRSVGTDATETGQGYVAPTSVSHAYVSGEPTARAHVTREYVAHEHGASPPIHRLPVVYDGQDLSRVADHAGMSPTEVISLHLNGTYTVAMIGFRPHFPYLIGMDERLATPRLATPRTRVPAGSVGIAGSQTGVYPEASPGGWNIIGRTDPALLRPIRPGDLVEFQEER